MVHLALTLLQAAALAATPAQPPGGQPPPAALEPTSSCRGCHAALVAEHLESGHERSFESKAFQAQYFGELLPAGAAEGAPEWLRRATTSCVPCHEPVSGFERPGEPLDRAKVETGRSGVICDVCHVMTGHQGGEPGNGNYVLQPGPSKFGPLQAAGDWHHVYSAYQKSSALCGTCHDGANGHGVRIRGTYTEWRRSPYAAKGVACQDCHMTLDGYLVKGQARLASGQAASSPIIAPTRRDQLYTHRFPGAHSRSQVVGALGLQVSPAAPRAVRGQPLKLSVLVDNGRSGHAMPTGSAHLRRLWLEVTATAGGEPIRLPALSRWGPGWTDGIYEIAGQGELAPEAFDGDVPAGSRVYRNILVNGQGRPTLRCWEAVKVEADTRLEPGAISTEKFRLDVPVDAGEAVTIHAVLRYLTYPSTFAAAAGLPRPLPVTISEASVTLPVAAEPARAAPPPPAATPPATKGGPPGKPPGR